MKKIFGMMAVLIVMASGCGGASTDIDKKTLDLRNEAVCTNDGNVSTCDASACPEDCTVFAHFKTGADIPVAECPTEGDATISFNNNFPGAFDIVCRAGDGGESVLLGHHEPEASDKTEIEPKNEGNAPTAPSGTTEKIDPTAPDAADDDQDHDGIPDAKDACPAVIGWGDGCPHAMVIEETPPAYNWGIIGMLEDAGLTAKPTQLRFGMVALNWNVTTSQSEIKELYLWSDGDFNRRLGDTQGIVPLDPCSKIEGRYLLVEPSTGLNYNAGSANADKVKELLTGVVCNNKDSDTSNDCEGFTESNGAACRINLKVGASWRTAGQVTTVAGNTGDRAYHLIVKKSDGKTVAKDAHVTMLEPRIENSGVTLDASGTDLMARVTFDFFNADPREPVTVWSEAGSCQPDSDGMDPDGNGAGTYKGRCKILDKNHFHIKVTGLNAWAEQLYTLALGDVTVTLTEPADTFYKEGTTSLSFTATRDWTFAFENGAPTKGSFTPEQTLKTLASLELINWATPVVTVNNPQNSYIPNVPVAHEYPEYHLRVKTKGGETLMSNSVKIKFPVESKTTPIKDSLQCDGQGGFSENFILETRGLKEVRVVCELPTTTKLELALSGGPSPVDQPYAFGADDYQTSTFILSIGSSKSQGNCSVIAVDYAGMTITTPFKTHSCAAQ